MKKIRAVISDSDGTFVNTLYLIRHGQYEAAVEYMVARGIPRHEIPPYETYEGYINMSVGGSTRSTFEATLKLLFRDTHTHHMDHIDLDELDRSLQPIQDHLAPLYVHPFHGLTELFTWLGEHSISLGIFTSGSAYHIVRHYGIALPALGYTELYLNQSASNAEKVVALIKRIKAVYGIKQFALVTVDDVAAAKPDPEGILTLMRRLGVERDEVIVMGDHPVDMMAARAAGVHAIGVTHGFSSAAELKTAGALCTIDDLLSLPKLIEAHNSGILCYFRSFPRYN